MTTTDTTRRRALGGFLAAAAALSLPSVATAETAEPEHRHPARCFSRNHRLMTPEAEARERAIQNRLRRELDDEHWMLVVELSDLQTDASCDAQDAYVEELARHFPGLAPALCSVAYHLGDQFLDDRGECCA